MQQSKMIYVSVPDQKMQLLEAGEVVREYEISTSRFGLGSEEGSFCTPLGRFTICEKIGDGEKIGTIFQGRVPVGRWCDEEDCDEEDLVLTRILWLDGLDEANANTKARYIYIHGTQAEDLIGQPAGHGCVRMRNADIEDFYQRVEVGCEVQIIDSSLRL